jgi:hypothetical protein
MPKEEGSSSLFDLASKQQKKKAEITPQIEPKKEEPPSLVEQSSAILSADEIAATFQRCKEMHDELKTKIENSYEEVKISPRKIKEYMSNPTHFASKDWEELQKTKKQYDEKLKQLLPEGTELEPKEEQGQDKKKIKSSFMSRKRWLSMH